MFDTSRYRKSENIKGRGARPEIFARKGGKLFKGYADKRIRNIKGLNPRQRELVKAVVGSYDHPGSKGITVKEFNAAMKKMADNPRDSVTRKDVEKIRKQF